MHTNPEKKSSGEAVAGVRCRSDRDRWGSVRNGCLRREPGTVRATVRGLTNELPVMVLQLRSGGFYAASR